MTQLTMTASFQSNLEGIKDNGLGLDLIFLVDSSGSMEGQKLANVFHSIEALLNILSLKDRVSVISFDSSAKVQCNFIQVINI